MRFQNPWGALALLLLIPLVVLYLLKQRHQERTVPSVVLWDRVLAQWQAAHPWQRWRKNLLFFLQALAVCLLAFALMRPVWRVTGAGQNNIIVLDLSLSMQAEEEGRTRIDRAKEGAAALVKGMKRGEQVTLLTAGEQNQVLLNRSGDSQVALELLEDLTPWNGGGKLEDAVQMAASLVDAGNNELVHVFTDQQIALPADGAVLHNVALGAENVAVTGVSYAHGAKSTRLNVLGLLHNFGAAKTVSVELWGDGALLDVKECSLEADSPGNLLFEGVPSTLRYLTLTISDEDALMADNQAFCAVQDDEKYRVLLQTERNVFLEKAILLREDIELYKTTPSAELPPENYALIIGDGWLGGPLPQGQDVWLIAPGGEYDWFTSQPLSGGGVRATGRDQALLRYVDLSGLRVAAATALAPQDGVTAILATLDDLPVIIQREKDGVKHLAFGFDLHDSNLPMQKDFPILVQNILAWYLPPRESQVRQTTAGSPVGILLRSDTAFYNVRLPDGSLREGQGRRQFADTHQVGFYSIAQCNADGEIIGESVFAVNPAVEGESELRTPGHNSDEGAGTGDFWRNLNVWPYLILCALALMAVEWWVYHRGA